MLISVIIQWAGSLKRGVTSSLLQEVKLFREMRCKFDKPQNVSVSCSLTSDCDASLMARPAPWPASHHVALNKVPNSGSSEVIVVLL